MTTRTRNTSSTQVAGRSTNSAASRRARSGSSGPVRCWSEVSLTVNVSDSNFIKFVHGFEAMSPSDSDEDMRRTEQRIYNTCEKIVEMRVRKLRRLIRQLGA